MMRRPVPLTFIHSLDSFDAGILSLENIEGVPGRSACSRE